MKKIILIMFLLTLLTPTLSSDFAQEITKGVITKIFFGVTNSTGGADNTATCTVDVFFPNSSLFWDDTNVQQLGVGGELTGNYYFNSSADFTASGKYLTTASCTTTESNYGNLFFYFEVVNPTDTYLSLMIYCLALVLVCGLFAMFLDEGLTIRWIFIFLTFIFLISSGILINDIINLENYSDILDNIVDGLWWNNFIIIWVFVVLLVIALFVLGGILYNKVYLHKWKKDRHLD